MVLQTLLTLKFFIELAAVLMVVYGVLLAILRISKIEVEVPRNKRFRQYESAKRVFLQKLIFALDFFVVSTILDLAIAVDMADIIRIGLIVATRTILAFTLNAELHEENNH